MRIRDNSIYLTQEEHSNLLKWCTVYNSGVPDFPTHGGVWFADAVSSDPDGPIGYLLMTPDDRLMLGYLGGRPTAVYLDIERMAQEAQRILLDD